MPKVSVIIPCYNAADTVGAAIDSVLAQTLQDFEIIVVDDGSTDESANVCIKYDDRIHYIYQKNQGPGAARNFGLKIASGEYISFLDADDLFLPEKLERQVQYLDHHLNIHIVYSNGRLLRAVDGKQQESILYTQAGLLQDQLSTPEKSRLILLLRNVFPVHAALSRKKCLDEIGGFDASMRSHEDWDIWYRLSWKSSFAYLDEVNTIYRVQSSSITQNYQWMLQGLLSFESKVENSTGFESFSPTFIALFYYTFGIYFWKLQSVRTARQHFRKSLGIHPANLKARLAYWITGLGDRPANAIFQLVRMIKTRGRLTL